MLLDVTDGRAAAASRQIVLDLREAALEGLIMHECVRRVHGCGYGEKLSHCGEIGGCIADEKRDRALEAVQRGPDVFRRGWRFGGTEPVERCFCLAVAVEEAVWGAVTGAAAETRSEAWCQARGAYALGMLAEFHFARGKWEYLVVHFFWLSDEHPSWACPRRQCPSARHGSETGGSCEGATRLASFLSLSRHREAACEWKR